MMAAIARCTVRSSQYARACERTAARFRAPDDGSDYSYEIDRESRSERMGAFPRK
jgi:hypothetical protein